MSGDAARQLRVTVDSAQADVAIERVRAELRELGARDRAAAPSPDEVIATMRANGLHDPKLEVPETDGQA